MKNNKGFTIIELIATIGIMVLIGVVIMNNMTGILSKQHDEEYARFKRELEDGACVYVEVAFTKEERLACKNSSVGCDVGVDALIKKGYIADDLKDPMTEELVVNNKEKYKVNVRWVDYVKTCTVNG